MKSCRVPAGASGEQRSTGDEAGGVTERHFRLDIDTINPFLLEMQYAVRGPVLKKAMEIEEELKQVRLSSLCFMQTWRTRKHLVTYQSRLATCYMIVVSSA